MIDIWSFRDWVDEDLLQFGFRRRGMVWRLMNSEVQWGVQLHKNIYSQYYMLVVGLDLQTETLRNPRDYPISGLLDGMPMVEATWVGGASVSSRTGPWVIPRHYDLDDHRRPSSCGPGRSTMRRPPVHVPASCGWTIKRIIQTLQPLRDVLDRPVGRGRSVAQLRVGVVHRRWQCEVHRHADQ